MSRPSKDSKLSPAPRIYSSNFHNAYDILSLYYLLLIDICKIYRLLDHFIYIYLNCMVHKQ